MSTNCCRVDGVSTSEAPEEPPRLDEDERAAWLSLAGVMTLLPAALDAQLQRDARPSHFEYVLTDAGHAKAVATAPGHVATVRALVFDAGPSPHRATAAGPRGCLRTASIR